MFDAFRWEIKLYVIEIWKASESDDHLTEQEKAVQVDPAEAAHLYG
jgi:hypothetical protein